MRIYFPDCSSKYTVTPPVLPHPEDEKISVNKDLKTSFFKNLNVISEIHSEIRKGTVKDLKNAQQNLITLLSQSLSELGLDGYTLNGNESDYLLVKLSKVLDIGPGLVKETIDFCIQGEPNPDVFYQGIEPLGELNSKEQKVSYRNAISKNARTPKRSQGQANKLKDIATDPSNR